ncbi:MAG: DUF3014 domain-containing protein [Burkholderiaceae bacterium]|nr:DUF3014 domain-containing protein [Burkholderiaceae bacterium]
MNRPTYPPKASSGPPWWLILGAVIVLVAAFSVWQSGGRLFDRFVPDLSPGKSGDSAAATSTQAPPDSAPEPRERQTDRVDAAGTISGTVAATDEGANDTRTGAEADTRPRYPVPGGVTEGSPAEPGENTDAPILAALTGLQPRMVLARFLNLQDFVRRFVVTVDNLPREIVPSQWSAVRRTPGQLGVRANGDRFTLSPENFSRYDPVVGFLESIDPRKAVAAYVAFYPLLQYEYRAMGFPKLHFSDRVVDAIDDMLSAPEVTEPIELVQPKVLYKYADPTLEKLSAGRKIMVRIGPENAARLKALLRRWRAVLVPKR